MISLILPFHSDFSRLQESLGLLAKKREQYKITEILLCHNGGALTEEQKNTIKSFMIPETKLLHTDDLGIGSGYKLGIENATQEVCILSASDLPFGFTDIESYNRANPRPQLAIGSKAHKNSRIRGYGLKRKIASYGFWAMRALFLSSQTPKDSQGTILIETSLAKRLIKQSVYNNYFFSVELITLAQVIGIKPVEIPVVLENHEGESSVSVWRDGWSLAQNLMTFSKRVKKDLK